ncbi:MAG: hypothetical protein HY203_11815 [Nitrospirae bacterium]|nr:hypothetical protein [Nitrospirota bacterium]
MKRRLLIPAVILFMIFRPTLGRAETHVSVTFSVGGAVVIGAGVFYWGVSYTSRVSEYTPSEENPDRLSLTKDFAERNPSRTIRFLPQLLPQFVPPLVPVGERTRADFVSLLNDPRTASTVELPLFVFCW